MVVKRERNHVGRQAGTQGTQKNNEIQIGKLITCDLNSTIRNLQITEFVD